MRQVGRPAAETLTAMLTPVRHRVHRSMRAAGQWRRERALRGRVLEEVPSGLRIGLSPIEDGAWAVSAWVSVCAVVLLGGL